MKAVFDTNVFRDIQRGNIDTAEISGAKQILSRDGNQGLLSPLCLIELGSHINETEKADFARYHDALKAALDLCSAALPDPEAVLREQVFEAPSDGTGLAPSATLAITRSIVSAKSYDKLVKGKVVTLQGKKYRVAYNPDNLPTFRRSYEDQYVEDMHNWVVGVLCPEWKERRAAGQMAYVEDKQTRKEFVSFLKSDDFRQQFFLLQAARAGVEGVKWDEEIFGRLKPFFDAYVWIVQNIATGGYNTARNKNDYNDIHFLLYLADPEVVLVTRDKGTLRKVGTHARVKTFEEWLKENSSTAMTPPL